MTIHKAVNCFPNGQIIVSLRWRDSQKLYLVYFLPFQLFELCIGLVQFYRSLFTFTVQNKWAHNIFLAKARKDRSAASCLYTREHLSTFQNPLQSPIHHYLYLIQITKLFILTSSLFLIISLYITPL